MSEIFTGCEFLFLLSQNLSCQSLLSSKSVSTVLQSQIFSRFVSLDSETSLFNHRFLEFYETWWGRQKRLVTSSWPIICQRNQLLVPVTVHHKCHLCMTVLLASLNVTIWKLQAQAPPLLCDISFLYIYIYGLFEICRWKIR